MADKSFLRFLLFYHINSYWIYKYLTWVVKPECPSSVLNPALAKKLRAVGTTDSFREGFELGELLYKRYLEGLTGLPDSGTFVEELENRYPGYTEFLNQRAFAWDVPLSYRDYDRPLIGTEDRHSFDKHLNLKGSSIAHAAYFQKLVPRIREYLASFSEDSQLAGFVDVGCGDGTLLRQIQNSLRDFPHRYVYIGVDNDELSTQIAAEINDEHIRFLKGDVSTLTPSVIDSANSVIHRYKTTSTCVLSLIIISIRSYRAREMPGLTMFIFIGTVISWLDSMT